MKTIVSAMLVSLVVAATSQAINVHGCNPNQKLQLEKAVRASDQLVVNAQSYLAKLTAKKTGFYKSYFGAWGPLQSQIVKLRFDTISDRAALHHYDCAACRTTHSAEYHSRDAYVTVTPDYSKEAYFNPKPKATINLCGEFWKKGTTGLDSQAGIILRENVKIYKVQVHRGMSDLPAADQRLTGKEIVTLINPDNYRKFAERLDKPRKPHRWW